MNFHLVLPLVQALLGLILLPVVLRGHFRSTTHRLFSFYLLGLILWGVFIFLMRASPTPEQAYFWEAWPIALGPLLAVLFYHFTVSFTGIRVKKRLLPSIYAASSIFFVLVFTTDLVIRGMQVKPYGYAPIFGLLFPAVGVFVYVIMLMALFNLLEVAKAAPDAVERTRSTYIITGLVFSLAGGIFDLLPLLGLPLYPGLIIGNIIFCILTTVAIVKYHILDIHLIIRKGTAYLLMSAVVVSTYVGVIILVNELFKWTVPLGARFIILILLALALKPLWGRIQRLVDRWSYRERYDFLKAVEDFSLETHKISDPNELGSSLVKLISEALRTSSVYLLLPSGSGDFSIVAATGENTIQISFDSHTPLLRWLKTNKSTLHRQDLDIIPQLQSLTTKETNELKKIRAELLVPITTKEEELVGILILGPKLSQQPYFKEDERLVSTVAGRMAIELENSHLYALERNTRRELERQGEQKTEFLHSVAHELKTPLTAIISSSELLSRELSLTISSQRQRLIRNISRSAWLMNKRVSELLDLAKIQVGGLELKSESLEISVIIEEVTSQLSPLFKNKEQSLKLEVPDSLPQVKGDREKLEQVLLNFLSNANKFSPTGGNITLRAQEVDDRIVVEVKDSAPSITEEEKEKLFDPYYRGGDTERQRIPGLGLGLAICKKLVELHQGRIWVEGEPEKGNIFAFSLPTWNMDKGN